MKKNFFVIISVACLCFITNLVSYAQENSTTTPPITTTGQSESPKTANNESIHDDKQPYIDDKLIVIGTGNINGIYYPAGASICRFLNRERKNLGTRCAVESTTGSIYNLNALKTAELDLALVQSDWQEHAYNGTDTFLNNKIDKLRFLFSLHNEAFTVIVKKKSDIQKLDDIKNKIVNIGPEGSGVRATMMEIMKEKGWTNKDFSKLTEFKPSEQARALCSDQIDVMLVASGHPSGSVQDVTMMCETRIIDVDDKEIQRLITSNNEFSIATIPGGLYAGSPKNITTFGVKSTLVATSDLSDNIVYYITKLIFEDLNNFKTLHPVFADLTPEKMAKEGQIAPYHPGALKYFKEAKLIN
jgi:TRAP transporter TAXI family solute receptor